MRILLQRVSRASVSVNGEEVASIGRGLLLLAGIAEGDGEDDARRLARKCAEMRIFSDDAGRFNLSLLETGGEAETQQPDRESRRTGHRATSPLAGAGGRPPWR